MAHQDDICTIMTMESGKPLSESRSEFQSGWGPPARRRGAACLSPDGTRLPTS